MLVRAIMTSEKNLTTLLPSQSLEEALNRIEDLGYLSLPVVEDGKFIGYISSLYIHEKFIESKEATFSEFLRTNKIEHFVDTSVPPVVDTMYVEEAADAFFRSNMRFIPVVNYAGIFQGILTQKALFELITKVYGLQDAKIVIYTQEFVGMLRRITSVLERMDVNITNIAKYDTETLGVQEISLRVTGGDLEEVVRRLEDRGIKVREFVPAKKEAN